MQGAKHGIWNTCHLLIITSLIPKWRRKVQRHWKKQPCSDLVMLTNRPLWMSNEGSLNLGPIKRGSARLKHRVNWNWWKQPKIASNLCKITGPELEDAWDGMVVMPLRKGDAISRQGNKIVRRHFCVFSLSFSPRMTLFGMKKIEQASYRDLENHSKKHFWGQADSVAESWYT